MGEGRVGLILEEDLDVARQHILVLRLGQPSHPAGDCLLYLNIFLLPLSSGGVHLVLPQAGEDCHVRGTEARPEGW